ncbi:MAG: pilus assembly protein [Caulobacteraceae bacterium]|nr:pilus assembly protein [Caulobacteraceae bacterium]
MRDLHPSHWWKPRRLCVDRRGAAAVEFALLAPPLALMLFGMVDFGGAMYQSMEVAAAAHAGADYALHNGWSSSGVQSAITSATPLSVTASPAPVLSNGCVSGGVVVLQSGATCSGGGAAGSYVVAYAQINLTTIASWPAFVLPATLSSQAIVRIH